MIMKKIAVLLVVLLSFSIAKDDKINLKIEGMQCSYSCADKVTKVVENLKGVKDCEVDFANNTANSRSPVQFGRNPIEPIEERLTRISRSSFIQSSAIYHHCRAGHSLRFKRNVPGWLYQYPVD